MFDFLSKKCIDMLKNEVWELTKQNKLQEMVINELEKQIEELEDERDGYLQELKRFTDKSPDELELEKTIRLLELKRDLREAEADLQKAGVDEGSNKPAPFKLD